MNKNVSKTNINIETRNISAVNCDAMSRCKLSRIFTYLVFCVAMEFGSSVKINELRVPNVARHNSDVILDCDYTLEDSVDHSGLVVKWFFNDLPQPVYQWIPGGQKKPQSLGILKDKLNLDYKASSDANTMHRALHILRPSANLTGEYTCVVSTFHNEDKQTKRMLVFVSERNLRLRHEKGGGGEMRVMCSAEGVFPRPDLAIRLQDSELTETKVTHRENGEGLYDISATATFPPDTEIESPSEFVCELRIPEANYTVRKEYVYYEGNGSRHLLTCCWLLAVAIALLLY